ncbi:hypothetical protein FGO68_gene3725 [Halteria grandinella]|uniref:Uncharacterized protein n=1 Tax=Halteria grandinella TaxID=5974 RepID=A0A8J8P7Z8_HALGN|nr:hypothetical protein FGO68_gene3725 [Halteria grandinella]
MESVERVQLDLIALWKAKFLEHEEAKTTNPIFNSKVSDFEEIVVKGEKCDIILRHNKTFQSQTFIVQ